MTQTLYESPVETLAPPPPRVRLKRDGVTVIVPCYNEETMIERTVREVSRAVRDSRRPYEIMVVDDGSTDGTDRALASCEAELGLRVLRNDQNQGYGYSLKRAVKQARYETIIITDADGTYPHERIGELIDMMRGVDMVVGARTGRDVRIPLARRPAKWVLRKLAGYLAQREIPDLNSGFRAMKKTHVKQFMHLLPDGFSFTTTITLALLTHGYQVRYVPIDYARRVGHSSIKPLRDTIGFLSLIVRTVMYFKPLKVFVPISAALFCIAVIWALTGKFVFGVLPDVSVLVIVMASLQILGIGLLADLIDKRSPRSLR